MLTNRHIAELRYLKRHQPLWWGVLERGGPDNYSTDMKMYLSKGLIRPEGTRGYVLTEKGERLLGSGACPHCGRPY